MEDKKIEGDIDALFGAEPQDEFEDTPTPDENEEETLQDEPEETASEDEAETEEVVVDVVEPETEPETPAEEPLPPPQYDFKTTFGVESAEEVKAKIEELEKQVEEASKKKEPEYANKTLQVLNNLLLQDKTLDINTAYRISSLNKETLDKLKDDELMTLKLQIENPEIADNDRLIGGGWIS
jgi:hypothetical protein